jgi:hypothetical protein
MRDSEDHSKSAGYKGLTEVLENYTTRVVQNTTQESKTAHTEPNPTPSDVLIGPLPIFIVSNTKRRIFSDLKLNISSLGANSSFGVVFTATIWV